MDIASSIDFNFNSSPFNHYNSAPSSPTRLSEFYCQFDELFLSAAAATRTASVAAVPFAWEEKPGVPKGLNDSSSEDDFSFDVSSQFGRDSVAPAEDLFHGGVIKIADPTTKEKRVVVERERGRERGFSNSSSRSRRTRSMSPLGGSEYRQQQQRRPQEIATVNNVKPTAVASSSSNSSESGSRKWSFKDLFLFRSASDGRAMDRDPLKKYSNNFRNSSESGLVSKRRGRVSAHELHYNSNRAVSNDMKKKTYLPYRNGILGGLVFNS